MFAGLVFTGRLLRTVLDHTFWQLSLFLSGLLHRATYRPAATQKTVLVVGASFAGHNAAFQLARSLPGSHRVCVVEPSSHQQIPWFFPRFAVVPDHEHKAFVPYGALLAPRPQGVWRWVRDRVEAIEPAAEGGTALLASGDRVEYDYLLLATGAGGPMPSRLSVDSKEEGIAQLQSMQAKIEGAKDVVVLGGGPAGIEIAGDIKSAHTEKNVVLVHSRDQLLNDSFGPKLRMRAETELKNLGIELVLGHRIKRSDEDPEKAGVLLASGRRIQCDCFIQCVGQTPNSSLLSSLAPSSVTSSGHVKVLPTLQVDCSEPGFDRIFAAGDVIDCNPARNARAATLQASMVAENIVRAIQGKKLDNYHPHWIEGAINLTLGLNTKVSAATDGAVEMIFNAPSKDPALNSDHVWKWFGAKPFVDESPLEATKMLADTHEG